MSDGLGVGSPHEAGAEDAVAKFLHLSPPNAIADSPKGHPIVDCAWRIVTPQVTGTTPNILLDHALSSLGSKLSDDPVGCQPSTSLAWLVSRQRREFSEIASKMSNLSDSGAARHLSIICTASAWER